jgi:hypothetical protein
VATSNTNLLFFWWMLKSYQGAVIQQPQRYISTLSGAISGESATVDILEYGWGHLEPTQKVPSTAKAAAPRKPLKKI